MTNKLAYIIPSIFALIFVVGGSYYNHTKSKHRENENNAINTIDKNIEHMSSKYGGKKTKSQKSKSKFTRKK